MRRASARLYLLAFQRQMSSCEAKQSMQINKANDNELRSNTLRLSPSKIPGAGNASGHGSATTFDRHGLLDVPACLQQTALSF